MKHLIVACLMGTMLVKQTQAGISAPVPSARLSADESRILVLRDGPGWSEIQVAYPRLANGAKVDFIRDFPNSGVYTLADRKLIHPIDWFSLPDDVLANKDLSRIARINRFGKTWAVKFYADGKEIKSYTCDELLKAFRNECFRPFTSWDYYNPWHDKFELKRDRVILTTVNREYHQIPIGYHENYQFDLATGAIIKSEVANVPLLLGVAAVLLLVGAAIVLVQRTRRTPPEV